MSAALRGMKFQNETWPIVKEYFDRRALVEVGVMAGYTTRTMPLTKAYAFLTIAAKVEEHRSEAMNKRRKKVGKK